MKNHFRHTLGVLVVILFTAIPVFAKDASCQATEVQLATELPSGKRWMEHLYHDLLPFWEKPAAMGSPVGNFPSFRYNEGTVVNPQQLLRGEYATLLEDGSTWITNRLSRRYVRMMSRQTYLYGVAYHLTGDERLLQLAKAGVNFLLENLQQQNGAFYSWIENGQGQPENPNHRTSQDMAYALIGPSFYYYLTRDEAVLPAILKAKDYIFQAYGNEQGHELRWINSAFVDSPDTYSPQQIELVSQLDQINAYMLLLTPVLPTKERLAWKNDMLALANVIIKDFYSPEHNVFWGRIDQPEYKQLGEHHVDFGHTIKSFWMLSLMGKTFSEPQLTAFALENAPKVLEEAFLEELGAWGEKKLENGQIVKSRVWWIYAELSQMAATLSLSNPAYSRFLVPTYQYWFTHFVDKQDGEVWHMIDGVTGKPRFPKAHLWKNGYHSFEHALVGYITSQALRQQPVELYFAFNKQQRPNDAEIRPYYFNGLINKVETSDFNGLAELTRYRVTFSSVK
jgi:mannose/cellobiose epimerase-like protein (N-acyl-D-glucosamine 2-epimerase family)